MGQVWSQTHRRDPTRLYPLGIAEEYCAVVVKFIGVTTIPSMERTSLVIRDAHLSM